MMAAMTPDVASWSVGRPGDASWPAEAMTKTGRRCRALRGSAPTPAPSSRHHSTCTTSHPDPVLCRRLRRRGSERSSSTRRRGGERDDRHRCDGRNDRDRRVFSRAGPFATADGCRAEETTDDCNERGQRDRPLRRDGEGLPRRGLGGVRRPRMVRPLFGHGLAAVLPAPVRRSHTWLRVAGNSGQRRKQLHLGREATRIRRSRRGGHRDRAPRPPRGRGRAPAHTVGATQRCSVGLPLAVPSLLDAPTERAPTPRSEWGSSGSWAKGLQVGSSNLCAPGQHLPAEPNESGSRPTLRLHASRSRHVY